MNRYFVVRVLLLVALSALRYGKRVNVACFRFKDDRVFIYGVAKDGQYNDTDCKTHSKTLEYPSGPQEIRNIKLMDGGDDGQAIYFKGGPINIDRSKTASQTVPLENILKKILKEKTQTTSRKYLICGIKGTGVTCIYTDYKGAYAKELTNGFVEVDMDYNRVRRII